MSATSGINGVTTTDLGVYSEAVRTQNTLGQDEFLQLLVAQLSSQDPLSPQSNTEFISQMTSFTSLEQTKAMQSEIAQLRASNLLGRTVDIQVGEDSSPTSGLVSAVHVEAGTPKVVIDGKLYDLKEIVGIAETVA